MDPFRNYDAWLEAPYQAQFDGPECECDCDQCMEGDCEACSNTDDLCQVFEYDYEGPDDYDPDDDILDYWEEPGYVDE